MLELVATMFLGLLLKFETVNDAVEQERSRVFDMLVAAVTMFVFMYPVVTLLLTSEKVHKMIASCITKLSKVSRRSRRRGQSMAPAPIGASDEDNAAGAASEV